MSCVPGACLPVCCVPGAAAADAEGPGCFYAAATTCAGEAYCWLIRPQGESTVSSTQLARVAMGDKAASSSTSTSSSECVLAAALEPAEQGGDQAVSQCGGSSVGAKKYVKTAV